MRHLMIVLVGSMMFFSTLTSEAREPTAEELRAQCEQDLNCARRNGPNDTEFVANATDPELCKDKACARHVNVAYPNDTLSRPDQIQPVGQGSTSESRSGEATQ